MPKTTIEIVSHAWAEKLPFYSAALCYQLSSLVIHQPKRVNPVVTVCCSPTDSRVVSAMRYFQEMYDVSIRVVALDVPRLGRRAIGRNVAAQSTDADIVWHADVDYFFGEGCLDALADFDWPDDVSIVYPPHISIHRDHATGDRALATVDHPRLVDIDPADFVPNEYNRAVGGVQIVRGDFARRHGYLNADSKWQKPIADGRMFHTQEDPAYRGFCKRHGRSMAVKLPNVYRLRHSECAYETRKQHLKAATNHAK